MLIDSTLSPSMCHSSYSDSARTSSSVTFSPASMLALSSLGATDSTSTSGVGKSMSSIVYTNEYRPVPHKSLHGRSTIAQDGYGEKELKPILSPHNNVIARMGEYRCSNIAQE